MYRVEIECSLGELIVYIKAESTYHAIELALYKEGMNTFQSDRSKYKASRI